MSAWAARILWFVGLWVVGVAGVAAVAFAIRAILV
jgi:hypothetical protein